MLHSFHIIEAPSILERIQGLSEAALDPSIPMPYAAVSSSLQSWWQNPLLSSDFSPIQGGYLFTSDMELGPVLFWPNGTWAEATVSEFWIQAWRGTARFCSLFWEFPTSPMSHCLPARAPEWGTWRKPTACNRDPLTNLQTYEQKEMPSATCQKILWLFIT